MSFSDQQPTAQSSKAEWRQWLRAERRDFVSSDFDTIARAKAICEQLTKLLQQQQVEQVLAYRAMSGEPDVGSLAKDFELFTTRARFKPTPRLTVHPWHTASELSRFGVLQPPANAPEVPLSSVQAIILPAMAFDWQGVRLGYGGGFYDRLLPQFRGLVLGAAWSPFVLPALPQEEHDCLVQWVVSEQCCLRC